MEVRIWALRSAEVGVLAAAWLLLSVFVIALGPLVWGSGPYGIGVHFPTWQVLLANAIGGWVALLFSAARAWQHQPSGLSWVAALIGLILIVVPIWAMAPAILVWHNAIFAGILTAASAMTALEAKGPITEAPKLDWGDHPVFTSLEPEWWRLRESPPDARTVAPERDFVRRPGKRRADTHVGEKTPDDL